MVEVAGEAGARDNADEGEDHDRLIAHVLLPAAELTTLTVRPQGAMTKMTTAACAPKDCQNQPKTTDDSIFARPMVVAMIAYATGASLRRDDRAHKRHEHALGCRVVDPRQYQACCQCRGIDAVQGKQNHVEDGENDVPPRKTLVRPLRSAKRPTGIAASMYAAAVST